MMDKNSLIYLAGHRGLVGSSLDRLLRKKGYNNILKKTHQELDLCNQTAVFDFFNQHRPRYVFLAAARVGGISDNNTYPVEFIRDNLAIQLNVIEACYKFGIERLLFLGSSCIYPIDAPRPIQETAFCSGRLEPTNQAYAIAKIAGIEHCWSYNRQYGTKYLCAMPTNMYGPNDNFDLEKSHVLAALIRKFHDAKTMQQEQVVLWGSGNPRREFLYADDLAEACLHIMNLPDEVIQHYFGRADRPPIVNVGTGEEIAIKELAHMIKDVIGFEGDITWDSSKPDGVMSKVMDVSLINELGWQASINLPDGIKQAYHAYLAKMDYTQGVEA